jgi:uncharacterized protein with von Willebrand factor type A (vWA) domain
MSELISARFVYEQEGNTDGTTGEYEQLIVEVEGIVLGEGGYYVIRTEGWSLDDSSEIAGIIERVRRAVKEAGNEPKTDNDI